MSAVRKSLLLSLADSYLGIVLQLGSTVIIARLLTPEEIGVFAVAAVFAALASTFRDFGVAEYLIQERELDDGKIRAALALNIMVSWSMAALLLLLAPFASQFYRNSGVSDVMRVQALCFVFVPFGAVTQAWFRRNLDYRPIVICNLLSNIASFAVAIGLAVAGFSYMSLAWSALAGILVSVISITWFRPRTFPRWPALKGIGQVFAFGKFASLIYVVGQIGKGAPELLIGRARSMSDVGMFSRANGLVELFRRLLLRPVLQVCMPYFAQANREHGSVNSAYVRSVAILTAVGWPFLAFLAVASWPMIRIVYGTQWLDAVPIARVLCLACAIELTFLLSREVLLATGQARPANNLQFGLVGLQILGLVAVFPFGLLGAAWGLVVAAVCGMLLSQWQLRRVLKLEGPDLIRPCLSSAGLSLLAIAPVAAWHWHKSPTEADYWQFATVGGGCAIALWLAGLRWLNHPLWHEIRLAASKLRAV